MSITIKNNRVKFTRIITSLIIFSALILGLRAEKIPHNTDGKVRILILSKHIRLMKDGYGKPIQITLPKGGDLDTGAKRIRISSLRFSSIKKSLSIKADEIILSKGSFTLYPNEKNDFFITEINGEKRKYPLPLIIKSTETELELSIEESINQFSIDSAWGELGDTSEKNSEALYALAHLIKARCRLSHLTNKHKGYHFCDLTCCQTYKGKSGKTFNDNTSINTDAMTGGLFFNTSGGGTIFTESIFNSNERKLSAPKDIIFQEGYTLSREKYTAWEASIDEHELELILDPSYKIFIKNIIYDKDKEIIFLETEDGKLKYAPESFRLAINRIKGWSFLKSNNYTISKINREYTFRGSGLGHGAGLSFEGALQLAAKGYSRYEILEHYYPEIVYNMPSGEISHYLQYIIFNSETGEIIQSNTSPSFRKRIVPCGSIFKLFIALYLAEKRTDLFYNYSCNCGITEKDTLMPKQCWEKSDHGRMDLRSALYHSCNQYFASLYKKIDHEDFLNWTSSFCEKNGIELNVPKLKKQDNFSEFLAGLNFNLTITVDGILKLNRYIYNGNKDHISEEITIIFSALNKTFTHGTAKINNETNVSGNGQQFIPQQYIQDYNKLWGKTGTVIAGTNLHHGYGIFTGGFSSTGIVAILRKGTGTMTAKECGKILLNLQ